MLDSYLFGNVERISPEAPVPVVDVLVKQDKLGGAANVALNIKNLGGTPLLCSVIGNDQKGKILLSLLKNLNINTDYIYQSINRITTDKTRIIGNNHQMLRIDEEIKTELFEDLNVFLNIIYNVLEKEKIDCILLQDYDKGVINETLINTIVAKSKLMNIPILVDPKKRNFNFYNNIKLFKPNFKEFKEGLNLNGNNRKELLKNGSEILHKRGIDIVVVTLSENGVFISYKDNKKTITKIIPGISRDIVDVSGAGDTVISVLSMLINDLGIEESAYIANIAGGIVCEEIGVVPIDKNKLLKDFKKLKNNKNE